MSALRAAAAEPERQRDRADTSLRLCDLGTELPLLADGSPQPKPVDLRIEKRTFNVCILIVGGRG